MHLPGSLILGLSLAIPASVLAQEAAFPELPGCQRNNSSRIPAQECSLNPDTSIVYRHELEYSLEFEVPEIRTLNCRAEVEVVYFQRNTIANVSGTLENQDCAASEGSFVFAVSTRDADNEVQTLEFPQTWARQDDEPVTVGGDFSIGEEVRLVRVRTRDLVCKCADPEN